MLSKLAWSISMSRSLAVLSARLVTASVSFRILAALALLLISSVSIADELPNPRLLEVHPKGGQKGTQVNLSLSGQDLDEATQMIFSHPGITAVPKMNPPRQFDKEPQVIPNQFTVTIAADVPPGFYEARVAGRFGVSSPRAFEVSDLPQLPEAPNNHTPATAMPIPFDTIIDGMADSENFDLFQFTAKAGQRLIILGTTRRIDSRINAVVEVLNAAGEQLGFSRETYRREPMIDFTAPADGDYRIKVADATYRGGGEVYYRLTVSTRPYIDFIWPPAGMPSTTGKYKLFGHNLPGGSPVPNIPREDAGLEQVDVDIALPAQAQNLGTTPFSTLREANEVDVQGFVYRFPAPQGPSNPAFISLASAPIVVEQEPNEDAAKPQALTLPCEVVGQFYAGRDRDYFSFQGKKGENYSIEVFSERLTLPTDPALLVEFVSKDDKGADVVRTIKEQDDIEPRFRNQPFDGQTHDPAMQFTADADGTYRILVRDLYAGSGAHPRNLYRMVVRPSQPDFQLLATCKGLVEYAAQRDVVYPASPVLRRGGTQPIMVQIYRHDGFVDPIALTVEGLPAGVTCPPVSVAPGQSQVAIVLNAAPDAAAWRGPIKVVGTAKVKGQDLRREAFPSTTMWNKTYSNQLSEARINHDMILAVLEEAIPIRLLTEDKVWETSRAGKFTIPFKFERKNEIKGSFKVELRCLPLNMFPFPQAPTKILDPQVNEGTVEVVIPPNMEPGQYYGYFTVQARMAYERNPEAAQRAEAQKQAFAALVAQLTEASKAAEAAKVEAEKKATEVAAATANDPTKAAERTAAEDAKNKAIEAAKVAAESLRVATEEQKGVDKRAVDLANAAKPQDIEGYSNSVPVAIKVLEAPIALVATPSDPIKQGAEGEISLSLQRLFDFAQPVDIEAQLPGGVAGITVEKTQIAPAAQAGKLVVKTTAAATPGNHQVLLRAKLNYNGQALQIDRPVELKIEKVEAAAAK
jgi:hypothetical protein